MQEFIPDDEILKEFQINRYLHGRFIPVKEIPTTIEEFKSKALSNPQWLHYKFLELCKKGQLKYVHYAIVSFPNFGFFYQRGFECACRSGNLDLIQFLMKQVRIEKKVQYPQSYEYYELEDIAVYLGDAIHIASANNQFHVLEFFIKTNHKDCQFDKCSKEAIRYLLNRRYYLKITDSPYRNILNKQRWKRIHHVTQILKNEIWTLEKFPLMDTENIIRYILIPYIEY